jgi:CheY-like chemotaxis protein/two-component sensor histidine kinase
MRQAGLRGRSLVQQLLTFSRPSAEGRRAQALQPLVQEALSLLAVTLPATVQLTSRLTDAPLVLTTDATQVQQIVINLCTNAWQAMPGHKGHIEVALEATEDAGRRWARLSVSDDGCGMDAATRERVFEPFLSTKASGQGTGLGLAMVHGIVKAHGGRIDLHSEPGQGTRFDIWLPLEEGSAVETPPAPATPAADHAPTEGRGRCLIYLDDDEVLRLTVDALLTRAGYVVEPHAEPASALAALAAAPADYAALVTDFNMPKMSGLDVIRALRERQITLPVLLISGHLHDELRAELAQFHRVGLLSKEFIAEQLAQRVGELLDAAD